MEQSPGEQEKSSNEARFGELKLLDVVSQAMAHNRVSLVRSIVVKGGSTDLDGAVITIELHDDEGCLSRPSPINLDIAAGRETVISDPQLLLDPAAMTQVAEQRPGELVLTLKHDGRDIATHSHPVQILAARQWLSQPPGLAWELLASFVLPNAPEITELMRRVASRLERTTGSSAIEGYQSGPERVDVIVKACWEELVEARIAYAEPPASWDDVGQKIRTPGEVIDGRIGTCMDTTMVLAAALEQAGIRPLLWAVEGHILLGWWRDETSSFAVATPDASPFLTRMNLDLLEVIETTALTNGTRFEDAIRSARQTVHTKPAESIIDIFAARRSRILPLPAVRRLPSGHVEEVHYVPATHSVPPAERSAATAPIPDEEPTGIPVPARVRAWKNSLLDLSLRNRLINYTPTSGLSILLSADVISQLEDRLHEGRSVFLRPIDDMDNIHAVRAGVDDARALPEDALTDLFTDHSTLYARVQSDHYQTRLQKIAHKARTIQEETGANNLYLTLGTLVWRLKDRELRSPLILIPITLEPAARKQGLYRIALDDTGMSTPNFCLLEKLRSEFGVTIPALANPPGDKAGIDLASTFKGLARSLAEHGLPFHIDQDAHLAVLMFGKFRLWKDLDEHWEKLVEQPLLKHLTYTPTHEFVDPVTETTDQDLDKLAVSCPIPADSSQLRAISEIIAGRTVVLEGPPGTGKSQTIANLLARCIAEGKRVLFVAEKRAALDVVRDRIAAMGLADFALDLHDKASRPIEVRRRIQTSMDMQPIADLQGLEAERSVADVAAESLQRYRDNVHQSNGASLSLYSARTKLLALGEGPLLTIGEDVVRTVTPGRIAAVEDLLRRLPSTADPAYPSPNSPWLFVGTDQPTGIDIPFVQSACLRLDEAIDALADSATAKALDVCESPARVQAVVAFVSEPTLSRTQLTQVGTPVWDQELHDAQQALAQLTERARALTVTPQFWSAPIEQLTAAATTAAQSGWWGRGKRLRMAAEALTPVVASPVPRDRVALPSLAEQLACLARDARELDGRIRGIAGMTLPLDWTPLTSEGAVVMSARVEWLRWLAEQLLVTAPTELTSCLSSLEALPSTEISKAQQVASAFEDLVSATAATPQTIALWLRGRGMRGTWLEGRNGRECGDPTLYSLKRWVEFREALAPLLEWGLDDAHTELLTGMVPADTAVTAFSRGMATASVQERRRANGLDHFDSSAHEKTISRYVNSTSAVRERLPQVLAVEAWQRRSFNTNNGSGRIGELRRLLNRQRGGLSVREMMSQYGDLIAQLMPCFLMSPDSLARFLPVGSLDFDLVVFDEASQIRVADAVGAMGRARSVAVVGDSKQMPPTSFAEAAISLNEEDALEDELGMPVEDEESILTECVQARVKRHWLSWHYRSQHESLIAFSNTHYYEGKLSSFPTPVTKDRDPNTNGHGINLVRVNGRFLRDGRGRAKRTNPVEAEAVVAEILKRFDAAPAGSTPSLGVVTFNQQQRTLIEQLLRECDDERVHDALNAGNGEGLFVKNLENVQGDERDVILFSVAFSRKDNGVLPLNFGPLNLAGGERRLNVAITRARRQVVLYCSFDPADLRAEETTSMGVKHLKAYLQLAQQGTQQLTWSATRVPHVDRHRDDIAAKLRERGWVVSTDVGLSDFRIDIVVASESAPEEPVMAVLLDGHGWADRSTVSDRDALPVTVLGSQLGWPVVSRVWLPSWLANPERVLDDLMRAAAETPAPELSETPEPAVDVPVTSAPKVTDVLPPETLFHPQPSPVTEEPHPVLRSMVTKPQEIVEFSPWLPTPQQELSMDVLDNIGKRQTATRTATVTLGEIILKEGPVHAKRAATLFSRACGLGRLSDSRLATILGAAPSRPDRNGFLWPRGVEPSRWLEFRADPEQHRSVEEISPHEWANAMWEVCHRTGGASQDDLFREALKVFGFKRLTANAVAVLKAALKHAIESGRVRLHQDYFQAV